MRVDTFTIAAGFCGPPRSGNGGYTRLQDEGCLYMAQ